MVLFIVPANLFESEQSAYLHPYLKKKTIIRAIIQLPDSLFKSVPCQKYFDPTKPFPEMKATPDVLLAKVPDMTDKHAMALFLQKIDMWATE